MDIRYISMVRGFVYLAAVCGRVHRSGFAPAPFIALEVDLCIEATEEAIGRYYKPNTFNTDQGRQFTSIVLIQVLKNVKIAMSMDDKGA